MRILLILFAILSPFCINAQEVQDENIVGLTSPITIKDRVEVVELKNLVNDPTKISKVEMSPGYEVSISEDKQRLLIKSASRKSMIKLAYVKLFIGEKTYSYLVNKSEKVRYTFRLRDPEKTYEKVALAGSFNDWSPDKNKMIYEEDTWEATVDLSPGIWPYQFVVDGTFILDPRNANKMNNNVGGFNSVIDLSDNQRQEKLQLKSTKYDESNNQILFTLEQGTAWSTIIPLLNNDLLSAELVKEGGKQYRVQIPKEAKKEKRSVLRIYAATERSIANDLYIPLEYGKPVNETKQLTRADLHRQIMYFTVVDRFYNGDKNNDEPLTERKLEFKANYQGGDLAGIEQKIKEGYFDKLNINSLWLSPITQNPKKAYVEFPEPHRKYSGYHGYWPISYDKVDHRFGTSDNMKDLVNAAHGSDMNVLLDFVCNHVHELHPMLKEHPEWKTNLYLEDGTENIRFWDEQRLTTWFDTFLPTIDLSNSEAIEAVAEAALYWIKEYDLDGFRHDATKHIPIQFWEHLTKRLKEEVIVPKNKKIYQIGETYGSHELISSYIGNTLLDAQFDFNLYFNMKQAFLSPEGSFEDLVKSLEESFGYYGHNHLMGNITGNHDMSRFITLASGAVEAGEDEREAGWARDIQVKDSVGYQKLSLLESIILSIPGIPVIYYGDEIGMPGAGDPDNRRMMRFENEWTAQEKGVYERLQKLTQLRSENLALIYGDFQVLQADKDLLVFTRQYFDQAVMVIVNKSAEGTKVRQELSEDLKEAKWASHFGKDFSVIDGQVSIQLEGNDFEILTVK